MASKKKSSDDYRGVYHLVQGDPETDRLRMDRSGRAYQAEEQKSDLPSVSDPGISGAGGHDVAPARSGMQPSAAAPRRERLPSIDELERYVRDIQSRSKEPTAIEEAQHEQAKQMHGGVPRWLSDYMSKEYGVGPGGDPSR